MEINRWFSRPESVHVSPSDHSIGSGGFFLRCPQVLSPRCCRDLATATCVVPQFLAMCGVNFEYLWLSPHLFPKVFIRPMVRTILMFLKCKCTIGPIGFPNMLFSFVDVVWTHRIAQSCSWDDPNLQGFWGEAWTEKRLCVGHFPVFTKDGSWYDDAHYGAQVRTVGRVQWVELGSLMGLWVKFMDPLPMFVRTCVCFCQELSPRHYP